MTRAGKSSLLPWWDRVLSLPHRKGGYPLILVAVAVTVFARGAVVAMVAGLCLTVWFVAFWAAVGAKSIDAFKGGFRGRRD